ncbi:MAG: PEP-CTERM sorting domain-containing protein [Halioglobus sp.]|nr:PEP-CTERM sorting domain-containing protein [Halioglobus sp.]
MGSKLRTLAAALVLGSASLGISVAAHAIDFTGQGYVTYGDGNSYSLPMSQFFDNCTGPGCDFYVPSTPGAIKDLIVVATGASGSPVNTNLAGINDAYSTPSGNNGDNFYATSNTANDPGSSKGAPVNDYDYTWDADVAALNSFLGGGDMVVYFNNNQINACDSGCQNLAAWARLWVTDAANTLVGEVYEFVNQLPGNVSKAYDVFSSGTTGGVPFGDPTAFTSAATTAPGYQPLAGTNAATDYVLSGGELCLSAAAIIVDCDGPGVVERINHNLGANEAAYAVVFPELNALLAGLGLAAGNTLHLDFKLGCDPLAGTEKQGICTGLPDDYGRNLNNGYEQIFIASTRSKVVPEPATLALFALGLLGIGYSRRRYGWNVQRVSM